MRRRQRRPRSEALGLERGAVDRGLVELALEGIALRLDDVELHLDDVAPYDENPHPRWRSLWALAAVDRAGERAVPLLLAALAAEDPRVVRNAAVALATYRREEVRQELLRGLEDADD